VRQAFVAAALACIGFFAAATESAEAQLWIARTDGELALEYGAGTVAERLDRVHSIAAYNADYQPISTELRVAGSRVVMDTAVSPTLASAVIHNGIWSRVEGGDWVRKTRLQWPEADYYERTIKYAVTILGPLSGPMPVLPDQTLQIIPLDPIPATSGSWMRYQVLLNGEPAAGAQVIADILGDREATPTIADRNGRVRLRVRNQGLNVVQALHTGPSTEPHLYSRIEHTATLTFALASRAAE
jgi:hypothetical protein